MEATVLAESIYRANRFLVSTQLSSGGWGYGPRNKQTFIEPTCWAATSLASRDGPGGGANQEAAEAAGAGLDFLSSAQQADGSWTNAIEAETPGDIRTALAAWTLAACRPNSAGGSRSIERALDWLMEHRRPEGGWAWGYGAVSYVEPTAMAVLALEKTRRLEPIREEIVRFVLKRQSHDGGWNCGGPIMLDVPQAGLLSVTPVAAIALAKLGVTGEHDSVARALAFLETRFEHGDLQTNYGRALWLWAWSALGMEAEDERRSMVLAELLASQDPEGHWDASVLVTSLAIFVLGKYQP